MPSRSYTSRHFHTPAPAMPSAPGVSTTSAPNALISEILSALMVSGMTMTHLYPRKAPTIARPMPVLPEVGSMMVIPSFRAPEPSASLIMNRAARSLMEPPGLSPSTFA